MWIGPPMSSPPGTTLRVPTLPGHDFNLPRGLEGLDDLAYNLWWSWTPACRRPLLTARPGGVGPPPQPDRRAGQHGCRTLGGGLDRRGVPGRCQPPAGRVPPLHGQRQRLLVSAADRGRPRQRAPRPHRLLLRRIRLPRVDADLLGRPGRPGRRPLQVGVRCGGPVRRRRPPVPPRLLPPTDRRRWAPGARAAGPRSRRCCRSAGRGPPTDRRSRSASTSRTARSMPRCGLRRSAASRSCCSTPTSPPTTGPDRPITHILYVRGREMRLCQELILGVGGVRALRELGIDAGGVAPERGALRVPAAGAGARGDGRGRARLDAADALKQVGRDAVFTIHTPVTAGNEQFDRGPGVALPGAVAARHRHATTEQLLELGRGRTDDPKRAVRHDRLRPAPRQPANAVSRLHARDRQRDLGARGRSSDRGHHQRRPRRHLAGRPMRRLFERAIGALRSPATHPGPRPSRG